MMLYEFLWCLWNCFMRFARRDSTFIYHPLVQNDARCQGGSCVLKRTKYSRPLDWVKIEVGVCAFPLTKTSYCRIATHVSFLSISNRDSDISQIPFAMATGVCCSKEFQVQSIGWIDSRTNSQAPRRTILWTCDATTSDSQVRISLLSSGSGGQSFSWADFSTLRSDYFWYCLITKYYQPPWKKTDQ